MPPRPDSPPRTSRALLRALAAQTVASAAAALTRAAWRLGHRTTTRHRAVGTVPSGYATGRADLQLTHRDTKADAEAFWRAVDAQRGPGSRSTLPPEFRKDTR